MKQSKVGKRYASALYQWAQEKGKLEQVYNDLKMIGQAIQQSAAFDLFLQNPEITAEKRQNILAALLKGKIDSITYDFILFLDRKKRLSQLKYICPIFEDLYLQNKGILKAQVTSARHLKEDQLKSICSKLQSRLGKEIFADLRVDPSLIGGFKIQIGDTIRDLSIKAQLQRFKNRILNM